MFGEKDLAPMWSRDVDGSRGAGRGGTGRETDVRLAPAAQKGSTWLSLESSALGDLVPRTADGQR